MVLRTLRTRHVKCITGQMDYASCLNNGVFIALILWAYGYMQGLPSLFISPDMIFSHDILIDAAFRRWTQREPPMSLVARRGRRSFYRLRYILTLLMPS